MSRLLGYGAAFPEYQLSAEAAHAALSRHFPHLRAVRPDPVERRLVMPIEEVLSPRSLDSSMELYRHQAPRLAAAAARAALGDAGVAAPQVDALISVSCTGYMVPALDVEVAGALGLRADTARLALTEHGCSGGGAALALAHRLVQSGLRAILVVCVELCSLTFRATDQSLDNLTASLVFGDGAAAAVVGIGTQGLEITRVGSALIPSSADLLGFELSQDGFRPVLDRGLAGAIRQALPGVVGGFGGPVGEFQAVHAGGPRIFDAVEDSLQLPRGGLAASRAVFRDHGNVSSASLLLVLQRLAGAQGRGLAMAFGPGLTIELAELRGHPE